MPSSAPDMSGNGTESSDGRARMSGEAPTGLANQSVEGISSSRCNTQCLLKSAPHAADQAHQRLVLRAFNDWPPAVLRIDIAADLLAFQHILTIKLA